MPFISPQPKNPKEEEKYRIVDEILSCSSDYYRLLGVKKDSTAEEIRRAYIKKSRVCHPDKFVPSYPRATESFQLLSLAYETLSNPSSKLIYDLSSKQKSATSHTNSTFVNNVDNPDGTFHRVLHQSFFDHKLFNEMLDGEFQTMRTFIHALNETNPGMHIGDDTVLHIELAFKRMRDLFQSTHQYYKVVQFELMRIYELQQELRALSYFNIWRRMQLSITICKVLLQLPIIINTESKQRQLLEDGRSKNNDKGILNQKIESALQMAVNLLETGERYTTW